ncbi:hypothetical protein N7533_012671 [Penicillium manginii]|uniref:uncharacterized protein n=1 Tax=Penicillium manginii TaxID=203109 RepID=UPI002546C586|nr:uncharacterized protein N7533_012671 [Penicillium manginii]KAJ5739887.1 hypothetical protein N7533_012671 [Penicillium manginii]
MSGFEIVGVVLGAIPLIISAIDCYKTTSQKIKFMTKKELLLDRLIQSLEEQKFLLDNEIRLALQGTHLDEEEIIALIARQGLNPFQDPEIADSLKDHLGDAFPLYKKAVSRCEDNLKAIIANISGLSSASQVSISISLMKPLESNGEISPILYAQKRNSDKFEFTKRIKFSIRKEDLQKQIAELNDCNEALSRLRIRSAEVKSFAAQPMSRTIAKFASVLNGVQNYAQRLYSAISSGCTDECHLEHETRLFLQTRSSEMNTKHQKPQILKQTPLSFSITFSPRPVSSHPEFLGNKYQVRVLEEDLDQFDESAERQRVVQISLPSPPKGPSASPRQIKDICQYIQLAHENKQPFDLYLSRSAKLCSCSGSVGPDLEMGMDDKGFHDVLTLRDVLLSMQDTKTITPQWTMNQRMALSFNIASSILQLHSTPWLKSPLISSSIRFMPNSLNFKNAPRPFILSAFPIQNEPASPCTAKTSLLELGILLLEIWHIKTIDSYACEKSLQDSNCYGHRYEVARHWLDISDDSMLPFHLELVTRCIECTFATSSATPDWSDITFRKSVCEYVLKPLWDNCPQKLW